MTISARHLWKIFGPKADRILGTPAADLPRRELYDRTGCLAAVRDVSFDVEPGEVFVVMGLSGSGKSTLVRCLTRLIEPTSGELYLDGEAVHTMSAKRLRHLRRHRVAMVFQHFGLLPHRKVADNVAYGLEIQGVSRTERSRRAGELLDLVGLTGFGEHYPGQLSGGMQQRVGLARALAVDPGVLLFDEPFSALDPLIRRDMQAEVMRLHKELGKTMVFITHDLGEALKLGDRIAVMREGAVVQVGRPDELVGAPADDYVRDFVRDVPKADVLTLRWVARPGDAPPVLDLPADTVIRDAVGAVFRADGPVRVVDGDTVLGLVDRERLLDVIAQPSTATTLTGPPASPAPALADTKARAGTESPVDAAPLVDTKAER